MSNLRTVLTRLLDQTESQFGPEVDLDGGFYWSLVLRTAYEFGDDLGSQIAAGDLVDDVETLGELLTRASDEIYLWHDLEHVIGVLGRIATLDHPALT